MDRITSNCAIALALCLAAPAAAATNAAETTCEVSTCYPAADARAELDTLYAKTREAHFDMFARVSEEAYLAELDRLKEEIRGEISRTRLLALSQQLLAFGKVGHARTMAAVMEGLGHLQSGGRFFPLSIVTRDGEMVLDQWADDTNRFAPGSRIMAIDGRPASEWLTLLRRHVSADNDRLFHAQLEQTLPLLLWLEMGARPEVELTIAWPDGTQATGTLTSFDYATFKARQTSRPVPSPERDSNARVYRLLDNDIAYLQPGPFFNVASDEGADAGAYEVAPVEAFYTEAFDAFAEAGAHELIIDLRGNPGGDNSFSDPLVARFADREFSFASKFMVKAGAATKARYAEKPATGELGRRMRAAEAATPNGEVYEVALPPVQPRTENRFDGPVYVLIDRHSYSNAAVMAAQVKDYGFGTIMGEETADLPTTYGSVEKFALPLTGANVDFPKSFIVRPSGAINARGVVPDVSLEPQPIGEAEDIVLDKAVEWVVSARDASQS